MKTKENRNNTVDILKIIAIIMVIIAHYPLGDWRRLKYGFPFWVMMTIPTFMILSGYTNTASMEKRPKNYDRYKKIVRFLLPFTTIMIIEIIYKVVFLKDGTGIIDYFFSYLSGGFGQGSYYNTIVIQMVFLFPYIYSTIQKKGRKGLLECFLITFLYEVFKTAYKMNVEFYRLLIFRYIFLIATGCYLYKTKDRINIIKGLFSLIIGGVFVYVFSYTKYKPIIFNYWSSTSLLTSLYIIPILTLIIRKLSIKRIPKFITLIAKSTYHIFLIQMLYYYILGRNKILATEGIIPNLAINITICISMGMIFYWIDNYINKMIWNQMKKWKYKTRLL